jgi:hypothetical protein
MGKVYPQALDPQWTIIVASATGGDYLSLGFTVYYNFDIDNSTWSNITYETYTFNTSNLNFYTEIDETGKYILFEISAGNMQYSISIGEYVDLNGSPIDPQSLYTQIISALGI